MSVFLSRLSLNLRSRQVRADLADVHDLHRTIMRNFDPGAGNRASQQVLFRLEPMTDAPLNGARAIRHPTGLAIR